MKLRHFAVFGGIFTVIICLLLFLFIVTADDEESGSSSLDFSGLNLSAEVLKHQPTVEKYAKEYGISDYVNYLLAIMQVESGGTGTTDVMQASESLGLPLNSLGRNAVLKGVESDMKILYVTDLHGDKKKYRKILDVAIEKEIKVIVNGGDMLPKQCDRHSEQSFFINGFLA